MTSEMVWTGVTSPLLVSILEMTSRLSLTHSVPSGPSCRSHGVSRPVASVRLVVGEPVSIGVLGSGVSSGDGGLSLEQDRCAPRQNSKMVFCIGVERISNWEVPSGAVVFGWFFRTEGDPERGVNVNTQTV